MSSFREAGLRAIKKYPEVFSALEEYEHTKRIPKFSYRKRIDVTIDQHILKRFREVCEQKGIALSRAIEKMIKSDLEKS